LIYQIAYVFLSPAHGVFVDLPDFVSISAENKEEVWKGII
jgi:hypothetical protein